MYARSFAITKHANQMYGRFPYIIHLQDVHLKAQYYNLSQDEQTAAYLHDTLEDTDTTREELIDSFNAQVAHLVYSVTGEGQSRSEQRESIIAKLSADASAINLKIIDRLSNIEASIREGKYNLVALYLNEHEDYMKVFQKGRADILEDYLLTIKRAKKLLIAQPKKATKIKR